MKPILFSPEATEFDSNGIGFLSDAASCLVTEELNGQFFLEMTYPMDGAFFSEITSRSIILAKTNPVSELQPFRAYRISKPMNKRVKVYAYHISQDLDGVPVGTFTANSAADAMNSLGMNAQINHPFIFETDKSTQATMTVKVPSPIKTLLHGNAGGVLDTYGGEYEFDRFKVKLWNHRGTDRGVVIRYGKNLTDLTQEENCANVYTGVYPYWADTEGNVLELPERILDTEGNFNFRKIKTLDLSAEFQEQPTVEQLRSRATQYMEDNNIGIPKVSLNVSFVQLEQTEEYKGTAHLERVLLGDTVSVYFPALGVSSKAKVRATVYDSLMERYDNVSIGDARPTILQTFGQTQEQIKKFPTKAEITQEIAQKLAAAMGVSGGCIRLLDTNNDGEPDELYIADNADPAKALKVWRFNYLGWAVSKTGYNGPFIMGATIEDGLLAEFVTAAHLVTGTIQSQDGSFFLDLDNGILTAAALDIMVKKGDVSSQISVETGGVTIAGNRLTVSSTNFKLNKSGEVEATGSLNSVSGSKRTSVNAGSIEFHNGSTQVASLSADKEIGGKTAVVMDMSLNGMAFSAEEQYYFVVNNGMNPNGWDKRVYMYDAFVDKDFWVNKHVTFSNNGEYTGSFEGYKDSSNAELRLFNNLHVWNRLIVNGEKNRSVKTENYGCVALNAVESPNAIFTDTGSAVFDSSGHVYVFLDSVFFETVDTSHSYQVFTSHGVVSIEKYPDYFVLVGTPDADVDWMVVYRQKGYTMSRLEPLEEMQERDYMEMELPDSTFYGDNTSAAQASLLMNDYPDTQAEEAFAYLENYEKELLEW